MVLVAHWFLDRSIRYSMGVSRHGLDISSCYGSGWVTRSDRPRGVELPPLGARVPTQRIAMSSNPSPKVRRQESVPMGRLVMLPAAVELSAAQIEHHADGSSPYVSDIASPPPAHPSALYYGFTYMYMCMYM